MVAFRFARAYTGKDKIIKFEGHYHGWADEQLVSVSFSAKSLGNTRALKRPVETARYPPVKGKFREGHHRSAL